MGLKYEKEKEFDDLINPKTKAKLRLDFYLPEYNVAIEYDGSHHHTSKSKYHNGCVKSFIKQKYLDNIKDKYCKDNNITLIRLNSNHHNRIATIINECIKENNIKKDNIKEDNINEDSTKKTNTD